MKLSSNEHNQIPSLMTPKDLASMLKVSGTTIYRIVESRKIPFYKINGGIRFKQTDIEAYMSKNRFEPFK